MHWRRTAPVQEVGALIAFGPGVIDRTLGSLARKSALFRDLRIDHGEDWIAIFAAPLADESGTPAGTPDRILPSVGGIPLYEDAPGWWLPVGVELGVPGHARAALRQALADHHGMTNSLIVVPRITEASDMTDQADIYAILNPVSLGAYRLPPQDSDPAPPP
jgi:hypothetical protein